MPLPASSSKYSIATFSENIGVGRPYLIADIHQRPLVAAWSLRARAAVSRHQTQHVLPARHFSGRGLRRNATLWASYALQTSGGGTIYLGGDSGYRPHFKEIGKQFGRFDLAVLENGQYDKSWKLIHMMPGETLQAAQDLHASMILPVHNPKLCISNHEWDAPLRSITSIAAEMRPKLITPVIGEVVQISNPSAESSDWWTRVS
jgi:L-ascorbate metabolism protein UlaG (beta-lactamase superfamily)